jgi:hypothetical protein
VEAMAAVEAPAVAEASPPVEAAAATAVAEAAPAAEEPEEVKVEFDKTDVDIQVAPPPPMKRVQVSNQMDILAELDSLRKQATMSAPGPTRTKSAGGGPALDLDALIGAGAIRQKELRRRLAKQVNSDVFRRMHALQLAIRLQDASGETIHTLDPVLLSVEQSGALEKLSLLLTIDLENKR